MSRIDLSHKKQGSKIQLPPFSEARKLVRFSVQRGKFSCMAIDSLRDWYNQKGVAIFKADEFQSATLELSRVLGYEKRG